MKKKWLLIAMSLFIYSVLANREYTVVDMHANDVNDEEMAFDCNAVVYLS